MPKHTMKHHAPRLFAATTKEPENRRKQQQPRFREYLCYHRLLWSMGRRSDTEKTSRSGGARRMNEKLQTRGVVWLPAKNRQRNQMCVWRTVLGHEGRAKMKRLKRQQHALATMISGAWRSSCSGVLVE